MDPVISIIVPVYKASMHVHKCVDSILDQTYKDFELILINDGSPDDSGEICEDYALKDSRVIVKHKQNGGVSSARNMGLDIAKGKYIMFVDSDDWIESNTLETLSDQIKSNHSDAIIFGLVKSLTSNNQLVKSEFNGFYKESEINISELVSNFVYYLNSAGMQPSWMYVFKASIIFEHKLRFNKNLVLYEDFDFNLRYLKHCNKVKFIPQALYHYHVSTSINQLKKRNKTNITSDINTVCQSLLDLLHLHEVEGEVMKQAYVYMLPMYTLCLKNIVIHRKNTGAKAKYKVLKQLRDDEIFKLIIAEYGNKLRFYKTLSLLINKQFYYLAYCLLLYKYTNGQ